MWLNREIYTKLKSSIEPGKVVLLYGPRRVGKTVVLQKLKEELENAGEKVRFITGEDRQVQIGLSSESIDDLRYYIGNTDILIIDEAQHIPNIGLNLKLIVDHLKEKKIVVSGSSSFDLVNQLGEPLVGRQKVFRLYPISTKEVIDNLGLGHHLSRVDNTLILGSYPALYNIQSDAEAAKYLRQLVESTLLKDLLVFENLKNSKKIVDLLTLLAYQIGKEVSLSELGNKLDLHKDTVYKYLGLLEKVFVLVNIRGFSRNLRKEVTKTTRYYFWDNGIRNALINNFNPLKLRNDVGMLWENYLVMERLKKQEYQGVLSNNYFWRTYDQKEIDWVEERGGKYHGYEFKYGSSLVKAPKDWLTAYDNSEYKVINQDNYLEFIT